MYTIGKQSSKREKLAALCNIIEDYTD